MNILRRGRLSIEPDEDVLRFSSSMDADKKIFDADINVDKAHVVMLKEQGIITPRDCAAVLSAIERIHLEGSSALDGSYEDIHIALEARLIELVGEETGGRMHSGRSRNDEVATCIRLTLRGELIALMEEIHDLITSLVTRSSQHYETLMPGYTHTQHAQPTTLAHHLLAHANAHLRDLERIMGAFQRTNQNPLGAAAFASTGFPIDRQRTTELLGFDAPVENSMDAVSTRDFIIESMSCYANLLTNLSRLAEELILWSTSEFDFIELDDRYASTSSIMPQKKNPDIAELVRGKAGTMYGALMSVLTICKALPCSYNRDLQEGTPHLWRATHTARTCVRMVDGMIRTMTIKEETLARGSTIGFTTATELADTIVRATNIPFRTAHHIVGSAAKAGKPPSLADLDALSLEITGETLSDKGLSEKSVASALDPMENIRRRKILGGTAPEETQRQATVIRRELAHFKKNVNLVRRKMDGASAKLEKTCQQYSSSMEGMKEKY